MYRTIRNYGFHIVIFGEFFYVTSKIFLQSITSKEKPKRFNFHLSYGLQVIYNSLFSILKCVYQVDTHVKMFFIYSREKANI